MNTPLLQLQNIGKIYVSDSNVSVGIRGVELSFNRGEFVAVTGKSGSGKSTLLNVISGMDTYEEGEMLVEGEPTAHFMQKDWEEYRKQYISFIFQDYNIIESFTVLQNVELALMHVENPKERRERALALLRRVGLEKHLHHKGSKLSGGQKQRTVIARALAKDSPIILADEPTGNLDSQTSKEIIRLLREVSEDKLVIVVTHNFEQVEDYATRHIRIFDGAVELDHVIRPAAPVREMPVSLATPATTVQKTAHTLRNGLILGRVRFGSMPKLSVFLCILMTVTALVLALVTSVTYEARALFDQKTMFTHVDGRTVIVRRDGAVITDEELEKLAADLGAENYLHYDSMLDSTISVLLGEGNDYRYYEFTFGYPADSLELDEGRHPAATNEVILEVPVSFKSHLGEDGFKETELPVMFGMTSYKVVGVRYYYDNTRTPRMLFTEEGYRIATAIAFFADRYYDFNYQIQLTPPEESVVEHMFSIGGETYIDFSLPAGSYFINHSNVSDYISGIHTGKWEGVTLEDLNIRAKISGSFQNNRYQYEEYYGGVFYDDIVVDMEIGYGERETVEYAFENAKVVTDVSDTMKALLEERYYEQWQDGQGIPYSSFMVLSPDLLMDFMYEHYYTKAYTQASLFFENDREAHAQVETLRELGYTAVVSDETLEPDVFDVLGEKLMAGFMALLWLMAIAFVSVFLSLCSSRAMNATRGDVAIMRSMGIPTAVIRISIYVQTLIALIPAVVITAVTCVLVYTNPVANYYFPFLHGGDYLLMGAVLVLIALNLSRKHVKRMFSDSVKKTLKGGSKA